MERRQFLRALVAVPFAPVLLRGMEWAALEPAVAASRGTGGYSAAVPPGTILPFVGTPPPNGFLPCDGRSVPRFMFPKLYEAVGSAYGETSRLTFRLPDLTARPAAALRLDAQHRLVAVNANVNRFVPGQEPNYQWLIKS